MAAVLPHAIWFVNAVCHQWFYDWLLADPYTALKNPQMYFLLSHIIFNTLIFRLLLEKQSSGAGLQCTGLAKINFANV